MLKRVVADIGFENTVIKAEALGRHLSVVQMPNENTYLDIVLERKIFLYTDRNNPIFIRVTDEDSH